MTTWLRLILIFLFIVPVAYAAPVFVSSTSTDEDRIYGNNDPTVTLETRWNSASYKVTANFTGIDVSNPSLVVNATHQGGQIYVINYTMNLTNVDGIYILPITAIDPSDNSSTQSLAFNITIDNTPPVVGNQSYMPPVVFNTTNIILNVSGSSDLNGIRSMVVWGTWQNGSLIQYPIVNVENPFYTIISAFVDDDENINFFYEVEDRAKNRVNGSTQLIDVSKRTTVSTIPLAPDGCDAWFVTEPQFILTSEPGRTPVYRFDSLAAFAYTSPFSFPGIPGGIQILNYWSNDTIMEPQQSFLFKVDVTPPVITDLLPSNDSITADATPLISAFLDDLYHTNSGVDNGSISLMLDGSPVNASVQAMGVIDALVEFTPSSPLADGMHTVEVFLQDHACLNSSLLWFFTVNANSSAVIDILSPQDGFVTDERRISLSVLASQKADITYQIDDDSPRSFCKKCSLKNRSIMVEAGNHTITLFATKNGIVNNDSITVFVDNVRPKIKSTEPRSRKYGSGHFSVLYTEEFLEHVSFSYRGVDEENFTTVSVPGCIGNVSQTCGVDVDISAYNGDELEYFFTISDLFSNASSKKTVINADTLAPEILSISPLSGSLFNSTGTRTRVELGVEVSETVLEVNYAVDDNEPRRFCSRCSEAQRVITFEPGLHNVTFTATDYTLSEDSESTTFEVVP